MSSFAGVPVAITWLIKFSITGEVTPHDGISAGLAASCVPLALTSGAAPYRRNLALMPIDPSAYAGIWYGLTNLGLVAQAAGDAASAARLYGMAAQLYDDYP